MTFVELLQMAVKRCWRRPAVAGATLVTLAAGIGLTASLFAILDAVLWRPLPLPEVQQVVSIDTLAAGVPDGSSPGLFLAWRDRVRTLSVVSAIRSADATIDDVHGIDRLPGAYVTAAYFDVLGLAAERGRVFDRDLDRPGGHAVVVVSYRLWQQRYAGDEGTIGRTIVFNGAPRTIIGVMSRRLDEIGEDADWWAPLALPESQRTNLGAGYLDVVGRVAPGTARDAAQSELAAVARSIGAKSQDGSIRGVRVVPFGERTTGAHRSTLVLLFGAVLVLFAIACANVANLLLADGISRRGEMAVRASLGATRGRLAGQIAMEILLVAACAAGLGLVLAQWLTDALIATLPADVPRLALVRIDARTALFATLAGLGAALAGGVFPALRGSRVDVLDALRAQRASTGGHARLRRAFVIGQVALTMALAASGALLLRSTRALERAPRGYDGTVLTAAFTLPGSSLPDGVSRANAFERLVNAVQESPGITRAAIATRVPLAGSGAGSDVARIDQPFDEGTDRQVRIRLVSPGYFATMGISLLHGREFEARDREDGRRAVIVNETLARRLDAGRGLVGAPIKFELRAFNQPGRVSPWEVVGVVADTFDRGPRQTVQPEIFVPLAQAPAEVFGWMGNQAMLAVRGGGPAELTPTLRHAVAAAGLRLPLYDVRTVEQRLAGHLARERVVSRMLAWLAAAGLLLSGLGMFAVVSHLFRMRRRELALRLALGATPASLVRAVVSEGAAMAAVGLLAGLAACLALTTTFRSLLFGVEPTDPMTLAAVAVPLAAVTLAATWLPARSVAALDPAAGLRED
jgi:putative ABC transport system permease protein